MKIGPIFRFAHYVLIVSLACMLSMAGCSKENSLSRSMAKDLILSKSTYPNEITTNMIVYFYSYMRGEAARYEASFNALAAKKLGTVEKKSGKNANGTSWYTFRVELTNEGKQYARGDEQVMGTTYKLLPVLTHIETFGDVTGITYLDGEKTKAVADYTVLYKATPFATLDARLQQPGQSHNWNQPSTVDKKAYFQLYDDGWRLVRL